MILDFDQLIMQCKIPSELSLYLLDIRLHPRLSIFLCRPLLIVLGPWDYIMFVTENLGRDQLNPTLDPAKKFCVFFFPQVATFHTFDGMLQIRDLKLLCAIAKRKEPTGPSEDSPSNGGNGD
jgi:hypothetical protein